MGRAFISIPVSLVPMFASCTSCCLSKRKVRASRCTGLSKDCQQHEAHLNLRVPRNAREDRPSIRAIESRLGKRQGAPGGLSAPCDITSVLLTRALHFLLL